MNSGIICMSVDRIEKDGKDIKEDIEVRRLSVAFPSDQGKVQVLTDVSLRFPAQKITGIVGESGSGKSVLGMSLIGLNPENAIVDGEVGYGATDVCQFSQKALRRHRRSNIALIPQNPSASLNPVLSIQRQIAEAIDEHGKARRNARVQGILARLHLSGTETHHPFQLSGGMKQRALIAMGMIRRPAWLLADEPTKGLDARLRYQVCQLLHKIYDENPFGIILISHDLSFAAHLCHFMAVLYCGRIMETGPSRLVFERPAHPYTQALLLAQPHNGMVPIPGPGATVISPPDGCPFHPRCARRQHRCTQHVPTARQLEDGRQVYCHYA